MRNTIKRVCADNSGATAIEYGLIAALVSLAGLAGLTGIGSSLDSIFTDISNHASNAG